MNKHEFHNPRATHLEGWSGFNLTYKYVISVYKSSDKIHLLETCN